MWKWIEIFALIAFAGLNSFDKNDLNWFQIIQISRIKLFQSLKSRFSRHKIQMNFDQ